VHKKERTYMKRKVLAIMLTLILLISAVCACSSEQTGSSENNEINYVTRDYTPVYSEADDKSACLAYLDEGDFVLVMSSDGQFSKVMTSSNQLGYINSRDLSPDDPMAGATKETESAASSSTEEMIPTAESTVESTDPTPSQGTVATVKSVVDEVFTYNDCMYGYCIPEVSISGKDMSLINDQIREDLSKYPYDQSTEVADGPASIEYWSYVDDKIVSICVLVDEAVEYADFGNIYYVYNISVESGELLKSVDVVRMMGMHDQGFFKLVKEIYADYPKSFDEIEPGASKLADKANASKVSYKYITPFVSTEGNLCFVGYCYELGEPGMEYYRFDTTNMKMFDDTEYSYTKHNE